MAVFLVVLLSFHCSFALSRSPILFSVFRVPVVRQAIFFAIFFFSLMIWLQVILRYIAGFVYYRYDTNNDNFVRFQLCVKRRFFACFSVQLTSAIRIRCSVMVNLYCCFVVVVLIDQCCSIVLADENFTIVLVDYSYN